jgi:hypothetical protein
MDVIVTYTLCEKRTPGGWKPTATKFIRRLCLLNRHVSKYARGPYAGTLKAGDDVSRWVGIPDEFQSYLTNDGKFWRITSVVRA